MNDYAVTKWAGELMCMNSAEMFGTETVRVRPVNCYGPHEHNSRRDCMMRDYMFHGIIEKDGDVYCALCPEFIKS